MSRDRQRIPWVLAPTQTHTHFLERAMPRSWRNREPSTPKKVLKSPARGPHRVSEASLRATPALCPWSRRSLWSTPGWPVDFEDHQRRPRAGGGSAAAEVSGPIRIPWARRCHRGHPTSSTMPGCGRQRRRRAFSVPGFQPNSILPPYLLQNKLEFRQDKWRDTPKSKI